MFRFHKLFAFLFLISGAALSASPAFAATIEIDGGTYTASNPYTVSADTSNSFTFTNGGYMKITNTATLSGTITGSGTIETTHATSRIQTYISSDLSGFSGTIKTSDAGWLGFRGTNVGSENVVWEINTNQSDPTGLLPDSTGKTAENPIKLGSLSGNGCIRALSQNPLVYYLEIGNLLTNATDSTTFSGSIRYYANGNNPGADFHVTKVGAGTLILTNASNRNDWFRDGLDIKEGTVQIGDGESNNKAVLSTVCPITIESGAALVLNRSTRDVYNGWYTFSSPITVNEGGKLDNLGTSGFSVGNVTYTASNTLAPTKSFTINNLTFATPLDPEDETKTAHLPATLTVDTNKSAMTLGKIVGASNMEIKLTGPRGNFLYLNGSLSDYYGTISTSQNGTNGTWVVLKEAAAKTAGNVTFNLDESVKDSSGNVTTWVDAGLLLDYTPTKTVGEGESQTTEDVVAVLGAISGDGIVRINSANTYKIQVGANNADATFSGGLQPITAGGNLEVEKIGTGTWTILSDRTQYNTANMTGYKNRYTGNTTITAGTLQLGNGGTDGYLGGETDPNKLTKIVIGENGTLAINHSGQFMLYNKIDSSGTIKIMSTAEGDYTIFGGTVTGTINKTGDGTLFVGNGNLTSVTKFTVTEGKLLFGDGSGSSSAYASNSRGFDVKSGGTLAFNYTVENDLSFYGNVSSEGGTIEVTNTKTGHLALRGAVTGSFVKTGNGALALGSSNGANLTKITVKEGILRNFGADRLGDGATEIVLDGGTFQEMNDGVTLGNQFTVLSASTVDIPSGTTYLSKGFEDGTDSENAVKTGILTKTGAGTLVISGGCEFTGGYVINAGTLQAGNNNGGHINNNASVTVNSGAAFGYNRAADSTSVKPTNAFTVNGGTLFNSGARAIEFQNVTMKSGGLTLQNSGTSKLTANVSATENGVLTFNGKTDGDVTVNVNGSSAAQNFSGLKSVSEVDSTLNFTSSVRSNFLNLNGSMSTFRGDINLTGNCWFSFNAGTALGSEYAAFNLSMNNNCGILFESGDLNGKTIKMGDLTGTGWVRAGNGGQNVTLEVGALGNESTYSGALVNWQNRNLTVVKTGTGNWTFASENQVAGIDYNSSENMVVREGTLTLNRTSGQASAANLTIEPNGTLHIAADGQKITGTLKMSGGALTVADGKTFTKDVTVAAAETSVISSLSGTVDGNVTATKGTISVGTNPTEVEELIVTKNLTLSADSNIQLSAIGSETDRLKVLGELALEEGTKILVNTEQAEGDFLPIEILAGSYKINDVPADLKNLTPFIDAGAYTPVYSSEIGGFVALSPNVVPEPAAWILLLVGMGGVMALRGRCFQRH